MKKLLEMFLDNNGDTSSKRFAAIALIASGITGAFLKIDSASVGILIGAGTGLLSVQAITRT